MDKDIQYSNINFRVTTETKNKLKNIAKLDERSLQWIMQKIVFSFLKDYETK